MKRTIKMLLITASVACHINAMYNKPSKPSKLDEFLSQYDYHGKSTFMTQGTIDQQKKDLNEEREEVRNQIFIAVKEDSDKLTKQELKDKLANIKQQSKNSCSSASWFDQTRTNLNSSSIIAGVTAVCYTCCYPLRELILFKLDSKQITQISKESLIGSVFLISTSLALEGVQRYWARPASQARHNYINAAEIASEELENEINAKK